MTTRLDYAVLILEGLAIPAGWRHKGSLRALVAWMGAESGWWARCDGKHGAEWNCLNTTLLMPCSAEPYNNVPVQNYTSLGCAITAVTATLDEPAHGYDDIVTQLAKPYNTASAILTAVGASEWGTPGAYLQACLATYNTARGTFNSVPVGPTE